MARDLIDLPRGEAHLWLVRPDEVDGALDERYLGLCTEEERARHARHMIPRHRREFLLTRALARTTLSRYADVPPEAWRFDANPHGRPEIAGPAGAPAIRFNLSNTRDLIACLVALDREIGVDVENMDRPSRDLDVADRFFSRAEVRALRALPAERQRDRFFVYWTLKEAYIKARGMGHAIPLAHIGVRFDDEHLIARPARAPPQAIGIGFDARLEDDAASWQFRSMRFGERHFAAVAIRRKEEPDLALVTREVVPLVT